MHQKKLFRENWIFKIQLQVAFSMCATVGHMSVPLRTRSPLSNSLQLVELLIHLARYSLPALYPTPQSALHLAPKQSKPGESLDWLLFSQIRFLWIQADLSAWLMNLNEFEWRANEKFISGFWRSCSMTSSRGPLLVLSRIMLSSCNQLTCPLDPSTNWHSMSDINNY